jgi:hypothetical protein
MPVVRAVMRDAESDRYRFSDLVLGIVKSAPFQLRMKEPAPTLSTAPGRTTARKD